MRSTAAHLPIIATTNLTEPKDAIFLSSVVRLFAPVSAERGGESRGCLSSGFGASFAIFCAREDAEGGESVGVAVLKKRGA